MLVALALSLSVGYTPDRICDEGLANTDNNPSYEPCGGSSSPSGGGGGGNRNSSNTTTNTTRNPSSSLSSNINPNSYIHLMSKGDAARYNAYWQRVIQRPFSRDWYYSSPQRIGDIFDRPQSLAFRSPSEILTSLNGSPNGWIQGTMRQSNFAREQGFTLREVGTSHYIQWHPGTPRHFGGESYWKVSSPEIGTIRISSMGLDLGE